MKKNYFIVHDEKSITGLFDINEKKLSPICFDGINLYSWESKDEGLFLRAPKFNGESCKLFLSRIIGEIRLDENKGQYAASGNINIVGSITVKKVI